MLLVNVFFYQTYHFFVRWLQGRRVEIQVKLILLVAVVFLVTF